MPAEPSFLFAGTPDFAARHLEALLSAGLRPLAVITQPDKPGKRGKRLLPGPVKQLAAAHGIDVLQPTRLRRSALPADAADLLVVVAYGQILRAPVLNWPKIGCINVHASLLPRWRGAAPIHRALMAGDSTTGVTIMAMDEGLDTGGMYTSASLVIDQHATTANLELALCQLGAPLLIDTMRALHAGTISATPQPEAGVTYAHKITKADAIIRWESDADTIGHQLRALESCITGLDGLRVRIWQADSIDPAYHGKPGEILQASKHGILVATSKGKLLIHKLQLPLGKGGIITAADALNARRELFAPGAVFSTAAST